MRLFWKVNEIKTFQPFDSSLSALDGQRSLVPKAADSDFGAENVPVFEIYFCSCFCTLVSLEWAAKAVLEYLDWQRWIVGFRSAWIFEQVSEDVNWL